MTEDEALDIVQNILNSLRTSMLYRKQHNVMVELGEFMTEEALHIVLLKARKNIRLEAVDMILNNAKKGENNEH